MVIAAHPLWLAGFRPFFALACVSGALLPGVWLLIQAGWLAPPMPVVTPVQWHAHEMFFGFGWAMLGGFLLTASKNWVGVRGYHGWPLALLAAAWLLERAAMGWGGAWPAPLFVLANTLFLAAIVPMLLFTLLRHRATDSYRDNYFFVIALPLFLVAKWLLLDADGFREGIAMCIALFRLAFLLMLERTLTQFMKGACQVDILRYPPLDNGIKWLGLALVAGPWLPATAAAGLELLLAALLALRLGFWHPARAMRRLDLGIMVLGYLAIALQLALAAYERIALPGWHGALATHVFGLGAMGLVIPAMIVRISKGHTGRKVSFEPADRVALWLAIAAFVLRIIAPQAFPSAYGAWLGLAAVLWLAAFGLLAWRVIPFLLQARIDGREH